MGKGGTIPRLRWGLLLVLVCLAAGTAGCVYLRLYRVQKQLAHFDKNFSFRHDPGAVITFRKPVLKIDDVAWLVARKPLVESDDASGSVWVYRFHKRETPPGEASEFQAIDVEFRGRKGRVQEVVFPPQFNQVLDEELFEIAFLGADKAGVDAREGRTGWRLSNRFEVPAKGRILAMLGAPTEQDDTKMHTALTYHYDLGRDRPEDPLGRDPDVTARMVFRKDDDQAERSDVQVGALRVEVWATLPDQAYQLELHRKP